MTILASEIGNKINEVTFTFIKGKQELTSHQAIVFEVQERVYYGFEKSADVRDIFNGKNYRPVTESISRHYQILEESKGISHYYKEIAEGRVKVPKLKRVAYWVRLIALACLSILIIPLFLDRYRYHVKKSLAQAKTAYNHIPLCIKVEKKE